MVQTRRLVVRQADGDSEPLLELARKKVALEGGSLKKVLRELREERRERARDLALTEAPKAVKLVDGSYERVSRDPRWPFGLEEDRIVAPFGLGVAGLPRLLPAEENKQGPLKNSAAARGEARDIIMQKLKRMGCDPIEIMAEIAMDVEEKSETRLRAAAELATMVYPRLRGVESIQRQEKTIFVIGVPSEQPKTAEAWLDKAEGPRKIAAALAEAEIQIIEGEVVSAK